MRPASGSNAPPPPVEEDTPVLCSAKKYVFDLRQYVWKEIDTMIKVLHPAKGMGHGGMRVCYEVAEVDEEGRGTSMVAKMFRRNISDVVEKDYFNEGEAQCMCEEFANNFNRIHIESSTTKPNISFLQCYVVRIPRKNIPEDYRHKRVGFFSYKTQDTREVLFVMEPKLDGHFTKYNSNFGEVYRDDKKMGLTSAQAKRRAEIFEAAEAFSHFTLVESGGSMIVCDLQGVNDFLTDPQIHTEDGKGLGMGNMGQEGIDKWVEKHECNEICKALKLQPLSSVLSGGGGRNTSAEAGSSGDKTNHYTELRAQLRSQNPVRPQDLVPLSKPLDEMTEDERVEYAMKLSALTS